MTFSERFSERRLSAGPSWKERPTGRLIPSQTADDKAENDLLRTQQKILGTKVNTQKWGVYQSSALAKKNEEGFCKAMGWEKTSEAFNGVLRKPGEKVTALSTHDM